VAVRADVSVADITSASIDVADLLLAAARGNAEGALEAGGVADREQLDSKLSSAVRPWPAARPPVT
jgi:hypothetical protein